MHKSIFNAYELLGISTKATTQQIKAAYKTKAHAYHPDKHGNSEPANTLFRLIVHAKDVLIDPKSRLEHDYALGIRKKPQVTPEHEIVYIDRYDDNDSIGLKTILGVGLVGLAVGVAVGRRKKSKKRKK